jgi:nucleoside-diphosphate-sugar epimerase
MKVAISGASGQLGLYVVEALEIFDIEIILMARESSVFPKKFEKYKKIVIDIHNCSSDVFLQLYKPDLLIHLAWHGLPNYNDESHLSFEMPMQFKFLKAMIEGGLKNLFVTGTCFEYGFHSGCLSETLNTDPVNIYAKAKKELYSKLELLKNTTNYNLTWARLFYLYGDDQRPSSIYPQLKKAVENRNEFFNMSAGDQIRDYLPLTDAANYIVSLALLCSNSGIVNICSGVPIKLRILVEKWIKENNWEIKLNLGYYPYLDYEPMNFWGDKKKLDSLLN